MKIAKGHQGLMPYLILKNASDFIAFAKAVFHAEESMMELYEDGKTVRHGELLISGCTLMLSEAREEWPEKNAHQFIYVADADNTYHAAIKAGSASVMELSNKEYGRTCGVKDPFGNTWWITSL